MLDINGFLTSTSFLQSLVAAIATLLTQFVSILFGFTDLFTVTGG